MMYSRNKTNKDDAASAVTVEPEAEDYSPFSATSGLNGDHKFNSNSIDTDEKSNHIGQDTRLLRPSFNTTTREADTRQCEDPNDSNSSYDDVHFTSPFRKQIIMTLRGLVSWQLCACIGVWAFCTYWNCVIQILTDHQIVWGGMANFGDNIDKHLQTYPIRLDQIDIDKFSKEERGKRVPCKDKSGKMADRSLEDIKSSNPEGVEYLALGKVSSDGISFIPNQVVYAIWVSQNRTRDILFDWWTWSEMPDKYGDHYHSYWREDHPRNIVERLLKPDNVMLVIAVISFSLVMIMNIFGDVIFGRWVMLNGILFGIRGISLITTQLAPPRAECILDEKTLHDENVFGQAFLGMLYKRRTCGDVLYSGHTCFFFGFAMIWIFHWRDGFNYVFRRKYIPMPSRESFDHQSLSRERYMRHSKIPDDAIPHCWAIPLQIVMMLLILFGCSTLMLTHEHYTVDVFLAAVLTVFMYLWYYNLIAKLSNVRSFPDPKKSNQERSHSPILSRDDEIDTLIMRYFRQNDGVVEIEMHHKSSESEDYDIEKGKNCHLEEPMLDTWRESLTCGQRIHRFFLTVLIWMDMGEKCVFWQCGCNFGRIDQRRLNAVGIWRVNLY